MITVREATGADVPAITEIFQACYGRAYSDWRYYDAAALNKLVMSDDTLMLVAEDDATGKILGTASVILEVGAYADLTGEFGRLAVLPGARHLGIGTLLMVERLRRVEGRLQIGIIEGRTAHPYTLKIAEGHQFNPVGFLPLKWQLENRESIALLARHFGNALELRKNHPRLVPEAYPLACLALENCGVKPDAIVDEEAPALSWGKRLHPGRIDHGRLRGFASHRARAGAQPRDLWAAAAALRSVFGPGPEIPLSHCP